MNIIAKFIISSVAPTVAKLVVDAIIEALQEQGKKLSWKDLRAFVEAEVRKLVPGEAYDDTVVDCVMDLLEGIYAFVDEVQKR